MREEYIKILDEIAGVDEIAGECAFENRFYDEVRALIEKKATAAASKPDVMIIDSDSEHDPTFPDEDADITDGDLKMAAVDKSPDEHRMEVAKVMASLQQISTLHDDTERLEAHKEPPKKANEAQSKK
jgi:hypothetical protein